MLVTSIFTSSFNDYPFRKSMFGFINYKLSADSSNFEESKICHMGKGYKRSSTLTELELSKVVFADSADQDQTVQNVLSDL